MLAVPLSSHNYPSAAYMGTPSRGWLMLQSGGRGPKEKLVLVVLDWLCSWNLFSNEFGTDWCSVTIGETFVLNLYIRFLIDSNRSLIDRILFYMGELILMCLLKFILIMWASYEEHFLTINKHILKFFPLTYL